MFLMKKRVPLKKILHQLLFHLLFLKNVEKPSELVKVNEFG